MKHLVLTAAVAMSIAGCSTFDEGARQGITLTSNAPAACSITQNGVELVPASPVPATHEIPKRAGNLIVSCAADGYQPETVALVNGKHPMAVTGVLLTGLLVNTGTDAATSSWHHAQDSAYIHLRKLP